MKKQNPVSPQRAPGKPSAFRLSIKSFLFFSALSALSAVSLLSINCGKKDFAYAGAASAVAKLTDLKDIISQTGTIDPVVKVVLKSEASGKIDKLLVKEGAILKKGDTILVIDPVRLVTNKKSLALNIRTAEVLLRQAQRDYDHASSLFQNGTISQKQVEDLQSQLDLKTISLDGYKLQMEDIDYQLTKTVITSPMAGILVTLKVQKGEIVASATSGFSGGTEIGTIADITQLEVVTQIGEVDYPKVKMDQPVEITLESGAQHKTSGRINFVSLSAKKEASSEISTFAIRIAIDSLISGLLPGVNVNVDFILMEKKQVLAVPYHLVYNTSQKPAMGGGGEDGGMGAPEPAPGAKKKYFVYRPAGTKTPPPPEGMDRPEGGFDRGHGGPPGGRPGKGNFGNKGKNGKMPVKQFIQVGETDYRSYEIISGLNPGDTVVPEFKPPLTAEQKKKKADSR
jgi:HlyD family secretion protein